MWKRIDATGGIASATSRSSCNAASTRTGSGVIRTSSF
jgi:hypothetical protein